MADSRIFADLKADHDRHRELLAQIGAATVDADKRRTLFEAFMLDVAAHAAAEEESLYATMLANPELRDDARHSVSEHKEIDDFLGELNDGDPASPEWGETFAKLRHRYEHHIDEEEEEMFPAAADALSDEEEERLGRVFEARKPAELKRAEAEPPSAEDERE